MRGGALVGKWREWWTWSDVWQWNVSDIVKITDNSVHAMPSSLISSILWKNWKDSLDGIRIHRVWLNQERIRKTSQSWNFSWWMINNSSVGITGTMNGINYWNGNTRDTFWNSWGNDCIRIFLRDRISHNYTKSS